MSVTVRLIANFLETVDRTTLKVPLIKGGFRGIVSIGFLENTDCRKGSSEPKTVLLIANFLETVDRITLKVPLIKGGFRRIVYVGFLENTDSSKRFLRVENRPSKG